MDNQPNKQQGATLLEMIFIIIIMLAMSIAGFRYVQQESKVRTANLAAKQIDQIGNAALSYLQTNGAFPNGLKTLVDGGYLPKTMTHANNIIRNPWMYPYVDDVLANKKNDKQIRYFAFTTLVPSTEVNTLHAKIANSQIVANNANGFSSLMIYVPMPGGTPNDNPTRVQYMASKKITDGQDWSVPQPQCINSNYAPQVIYGLDAFCSGGTCAQQANLQAIAAVNITCTPNNNPSDPRYNLKLQSSQISNMTFSSFSGGGDSNSDIRTNDYEFSDSGQADGLNPNYSDGNPYQIHKKRQGDSNCDVGAENCQEPGSFWAYQSGQTGIPDIEMYNATMTLDNTQVNTLTDSQTTVNSSGTTGWLWAVTRCVKKTSSYTNPCTQEKMDEHN